MHRDFSLNSGWKCHSVLAYSRRQGSSEWKIQVWSKLALLTGMTLLCKALSPPRRSRGSGIGWPRPSFHRTDGCLSASSSRVQHWQLFWALLPVCFYSKKAPLQRCLLSTIILLTMVYLKSALCSSACSGRRRMILEASRVPSIISLWSGPSMAWIFVK